MVMKKTIKNTVNRMIEVFGQTALGRFVLNQMLSNAMSNSIRVNHNGISLSLATPNSLCTWRAQTFSTKEPETLEWIDSMHEGSIIWDVGANVGLYSLYAAKKKNSQVWAFEPSVFNLELLARNIFKNSLTKNICVIPLPLSAEVGSSMMRMTTTEWGGALSTFHKEFGWDGKKIRQIFEFQTIGISMDYAIKTMSIPQPEYIKMDVDGLEHFILRGGRSVLMGIKSILIEVNDDFIQQSEQCAQLLSEAGLVLSHKKHSEMISTSTTGFQNSYNQIWTRPEQ